MIGITHYIIIVQENIMMQHKYKKDVSTYYHGFNEYREVN